MAPMKSAEAQLEIAFFWGQKVMGHAAEGEHEGGVILAGTFH